MVLRMLSRFQEHGFMGSRNPHQPSLVKFLAFMLKAFILEESLWRQLAAKQFILRNKKQLVALKQWLGCLPLHPPLCILSSHKVVCCSVIECSCTHGAFHFGLFSPFPGWNPSLTSWCCRIPFCKPCCLQRTWWNMRPAPFPSRQQVKDLYGDQLQRQVLFSFTLLSFLYVCKWLLLQCWEALEEMGGLYRLRKYSNSNGVRLVFKNCNNTCSYPLECHEFPATPQKCISNPVQILTMQASCKWYLGRLGTLSIGS